MKDIADTVSESRLGGFVIAEHRCEKHQFLPERMKFDLGSMVFYSAFCSITCI